MEPLWANSWKVGRSFVASCCRIVEPLWRIVFVAGKKVEVNIVEVTRHNPPNVVQQESKSEWFFKSQWQPAFIAPERALCFCRDPNDSNSLSLSLSPHKLTCSTNATATTTLWLPGISYSSEFVEEGIASGGVEQNLRLLQDRGELIVLGSIRKWLTLLRPFKKSADFRLENRTFNYPVV